MINNYKVIFYTFIAFFIYFTPILIQNEVKTVFFHLVDYLKLNYYKFFYFSALIFVCIGTIKQIYSSNKKNDLYKYIRIISIFIVFTAVYKKNDLFLIDDDTLFILNEIILNFIVSVFVGSLFCYFLTDFALIEFFEYYFSNLSKKLFNISGRGLFCVFVFLFTNIFFGFFVLNKLYQKGKLRQNEACMIFINFSLFPICFYNYILEYLNLDKLSVGAFSFFVFVLINAFLSRIYPINQKKKSYCVKNKVNKKKYKQKSEVIEFVTNQTKNKSLINETRSNVYKSIETFMNVLPDIALIMFFVSSILLNDKLLEFFEMFFVFVLETLKLENAQEIAKAFIFNFYNSIFALENINTNSDVGTKILLFLIFSINSITLTTNIIYSKTVKIPVSVKDFVFSYFIKSFLILLVYTLFFYFYKGYFLVT